MLLASKPGQDGWCGTCYPGDLNPGDEGFCDKYGGKSESGSKQEMGKPRADKNWGWCAVWCKNTAGSNLEPLLGDANTRPYEHWPLHDYLVSTGLLVFILSVMTYAFSKER